MPHNVSGKGYKVSLGGFPTNAVSFGGDTDFNTSDITGITDSKQFTMSVWVYPANVSGYLATFRDLTSHSRFLVLRANTGSLVVEGYPASAANRALRADAPAGSVPNSTWSHILYSVDLATGTVQCYINDSAITLTIYQAEDDFIEFSQPDNYWMYSGSSGGVEYEGDTAEMWFHTTHYDLSVEANRRKFISADLKPVDIGATLPTPLVYFTGDASVWNSGSNNSGSGNAFTVNGPAVTDSNNEPVQGS